MTREEAIRILASSCISGSKQTEALETLIPELTESEDERIRKKMIEHFKSKTKDTWCNMPVKSILAWLEKQKEPNYLNKFTKLPHLNSDYEVVDDWAYTPSLAHCDGNWGVCWIHCEDGDTLHECIGDTPAEAIDKAIEWFTSLEKPIRTKEVGAIISSRDKEETACGYLERCLTPDMRKVWYEACDELKKACFQEAEKQKDASKAIEAVDRIDKYIDEHLANAHDMKDSNPDKKYYRGWDDALGKMAGILQDVYSNEKQKEQKPEHFELKAGKWYICHRAFCCRADHLTVKEGERFQCEKDGIVKGFVIKEPEKYFKECSAPAPMEDEQKEPKPIIQDVELNDAVYDYVRDHFIAGADFTPEYIKKLMENAFFAGVDYYLLKQEYESCEPDTNVEKVIEDVIRVYGKTQGEWVGGYDVDTLIVNLRRAFNKKEQKPEEQDIDVIKMSALLTADRLASAEMTGGLKERKEILENPEKYGSQKPAEWSEDEKACLNEAIETLDKLGYDGMADNLKHLHPQPKQEWSEEDEMMLNSIIATCKLEQEAKDSSPARHLYEMQEQWLNSIRPQPHKEISIEKAIKWLDDTFYFLDNSSGRGRDCEITTHDFDSLEEMYNSFRKAVTVDSEPQWKPSEEQMEALLNIEGDLRAFQYNDKAKIIAELYEQLKRL